MIASVKYNLAHIIECVDRSTSDRKRAAGFSEKKMRHKSREKTPLWAHVVFRAENALINENMSAVGSTNF